MHFMVMKKSRKCSAFVIYSYFKEVAFTAVKRDVQFLTRYVKGVPFAIRRYICYRSKLNSGQNILTEIDSQIPLSASPNYP